MPHFLHPFSTALHREGGVQAAFDGTYNFTPVMGHRGERHCHDHYEIYIHLQGGDLFSLESELVPMVPNQLVIIPPYWMHGLIYDQPLRDYERMFLNITPAALAAAGGGFVSFPEVLAAAMADGNPFFPMDAADAQACKACIQRMMRPAGPDDGLAAFEAYRSMLEYLHIVAKTVRSAAPAKERVTVGPLIQQVMNYLDEHFTEPICLSDVASAFHISVSYLCHEFSRFNRHSIYDYVLYRRVTLACEMVAPGESLTDIAFRCGFNSYNAFARAFHKFLGMSPRAYLNQK